MKEDKIWREVLFQRGDFKSLGFWEFTQVNMEKRIYAFTIQ